jgi:two-component system, sensor histidine kinase and response regulator
MQDELNGRSRDSRPPRSILVVERDALIAGDVRSALLRFGYSVPPAAESAADALLAVEIYQPDLVLMDVHLQEQDDGIFAAAAIRARHPTPVVFLAAQADDATLMRAQEEAQPHGYVLKPYGDRELRAAVEVALQRHALEQEVSQQRSLMAGVLSGMSDAIAAVDAQGNIVLANEPGRRAFGDAIGGAQSPPPTHGHGMYELDGETPFRTEDLPFARALAGEIVRDVEVFVRSVHDPEGRLYSVNAAPQRDANDLVCGAVAVGRDVTDLLAARSELREQSETDPLTGAYNRRGFLQVAQKAFDVARGSGRQPAVFFIDLNGMKSINDSLGHAEGDRMLMDVTWVLRGCFRTSDIVGRLGGDEFVVLAPDAGEHADVLRERLCAAVMQFNTGSERPYRISISVGMSRCSTEDSLSLEALVEQADRRMYEDKLARSARRARNMSVVPPPAASRPGPPPSAASARPRAVPAVRASPSGLAAVSFSSRPANGPPEKMAPKRILLVDDQSPNLALLEALLAPLGHELVMADDGLSALAAYTQFKPDLVLLDLVMPGLDGLEVLKHIRAESGADHVPVIVLTAHSEREHNLRGLEAGADDFLEKPADGRGLRIRVSTLLQLKDSRDVLRRLNEQLEARNEELGRLQREQRDLTAFVVHDLKSPLAALWSNLEYARQAASDSLDLQDALDDAARACQRLRSMIDDLLVISRLEDSEFPIHNELIGLSDLLREVLFEYVRQAAERRVHLLEPPRTSAHVRGDRALLQRVIQNILDNSLRHTPEQGRMGIATQSDGAVEITISNSGPAIPASDRLRIFEKFTRIEKGTTTGNAGLGLYFCKRAIEALGGTISVTETPEWPTSFVLRLPA